MKVWVCISYSIALAEVWGCECTWRTPGWQCQFYMNDTITLIFYVRSQAQRTALLRPVDQWKLLLVIPLIFKKFDGQHNLCHLIIHAGRRRLYSPYIQIQDVHGLLHTGRTFLITEYFMFGSVGSFTALGRSSFDLPSKFFHLCWWMYFWCCTFFARNPLLKSVAGQCI